MAFLARSATTSCIQSAPSAVTKRRAADRSAPRASKKALTVSLESPLAAQTTLPVAWFYTTVK